MQTVYFIFTTHQGKRNVPRTIPFLYSIHVSTVEWRKKEPLLRTLKIALSGSLQIYRSAKLIIQLPNTYCQDQRLSTITLFLYIQHIFSIDAVAIRFQLVFRKSLVLNKSFSTIWNWSSPHVLNWLSVLRCSWLENTTIHFFIHLLHFKQMINLFFVPYWEKGSSSSFIMTVPFFQILSIP